MRAIIAVSVLLVLCATVHGEPDIRILQGEALAREMCAHCHAVGATGQSPHPAAPAFRAMERRLEDLDHFFDRLRQGLTSGHPDMPTYLFRRDDARNLIAYLRSLQKP